MAFVLIIEQEDSGRDDGRFVSTHATEADALKHLAVYVREGWQWKFEDADPPADDQEAIDMYYDPDNCDGSEKYEITEVR